MMPLNILFGNPTKMIGNKESTMAKTKKNSKVVKKKAKTTAKKRVGKKVAKKTTKKKATPKKVKKITPKKKHKVVKKVVKKATVKTKKAKKVAVVKNPERYVYAKKDASGNVKKSQGVAFPSVKEMQTLNKGLDSDLEAINKLHKSHGNPKTIAKLQKRITARASEITKWDKLIIYAQDEQKKLIKQGMDVVGRAVKEVKLKPHDSLIKKFKTAKKVTKSKNKGRPTMAKKAKKSAKKSVAKKSKKAKKVVSKKTSHKKVSHKKAKRVAKRRIGKKSEKRSLKPETSLVVSKGYKPSKKTFIHIRNPQGGSMLAKVKKYLKNDMTELGMLAVGGAAYEGVNDLIKRFFPSIAAKISGNAYLKPVADMVLPLALGIGAGIAGDKIKNPKAKKAMNATAKALIAVTAMRVGLGLYGSLAKKFVVGTPALAGYAYAPSAQLQGWNGQVSEDKVSEGDFGNADFGKYVTSDNMNGYDAQDFGDESADFGEGSN